uniref:Uncharacterized protein n=1 Tax=Anopheles funestus TaxID=62324 RepID=A0A182RD23_ANOFN
MPGTRSKVKPQKQFKISRRKLCHALERLDSLSKETQPTEQTFPGCNGSIINQLNTSRYLQSINFRSNWLNMFTTSVTRHDWDTFIKTLRLASQNQNHCGVSTVMRNSVFAVLTHPIYKDEDTLRLLLHTIAPCRSENDIEFCIETILRTFDGNPVDS